MTDFSNPFYPYIKVERGANGFIGAEEIPYKILMYLMDLPDRNGYEPIDDNTRPRVRLAKYIWYDGGNPLGEPLPTPSQKLSMLFDGDNPVLDTETLKAQHPQGYRLYAQTYWGQSQTQAQTTIKCHIGRVIPLSPFKAMIGLTFEIACNVNIEANTRLTAYARSYAIEQCILESLSGVNITGIGTVSFSRVDHGDNGSRPIWDSGTNVGRELKMSMCWMESTEPSITIY